MVRVHASVVFSHKLTLVTFVHVEGDSQAAFELCHLRRCSRALLWNSDRRADVCKHHSAGVFQGVLWRVPCEQGACSRSPCHTLSLREPIPCDVDDISDHKPTKR